MCDDKVNLPAHDFTEPIQDLIKMRPSVRIIIPALRHKGLQFRFAGVFLDHGAKWGIFMGHDTGNDLCREQRKRTNISFQALSVFTEDETTSENRTKSYHLSHSKDMLLPTDKAEVIRDDWEGAQFFPHFLQFTRLQILSVFNK